MATNDRAAGEASGDEPPPLPTQPRAEDTKNAEALLRDPEATAEAMSEAVSKAGRVRKALGEAFEVVRATSRLVLAYVRGDYRDVSVRTILLLVGALVYFLSPFDVIPDFIPALGYTDDAALLLATAKAMRADIAAFLDWEKKRAAKPRPE